MTRRSTLLDGEASPRREAGIAGLLFVVTLGSVFVARFSGTGGVDQEPWHSSALFAVSLMSILAAHELGHVLVARQWGFRLSLPFFLPMPFVVGTLGAIIRFRELPRSREGLLAMGVAGPIAGMAAVIGLLSLRYAGGWGATPAGDMLSTPLLFHAVASLIGTMATTPSVSDPLLFACWIGCLLTALNLMPLGQLDGGHLVSARFPESARAVGWAVTAMLVIGGLFWPGWWVWAAAAHAVGGRRPVAVRASGVATANSPMIVGLLLFILCFTPVPFSA